MKRVFAVVAIAASLFLIAGTAAAAAGRSGGGHSGGGHSGGGHSGGGHSGHGHFGHGHFGHGHVVVGGGVWVGPYWGPYWDPWYPWYPPYAYAPYESAYSPPVASDSYIEQPAPTYWYYCEGARAYYPYVRECPAGWLTVVPPASTEPQR